jgi:hypothetical protein
MPSLSDKDDSERSLRQIIALLHFVIGLSRQLVGKPADQNIVKDVVRRLIELAAASSAQVMASADIRGVVSTALADSMGLLSAENFLVITKNVATGEDEQVSIPSVKHQVVA